MLKWRKPSCSRSVSHHHRFTAAKGREVSRQMQYANYSSGDTQNRGAPTQTRKEGRCPERRSGMSSSSRDLKGKVGMGGKEKGKQRYSPEQRHAGGGSRWDPGCASFLHWRRGMAGVRERGPLARPMGLGREAAREGGRRAGGRSARALEARQGGLQGEGNRVRVARWADLSGSKLEDVPERDEIVDKDTRGDEGLDAGRS